MGELPMARIVTLIVSVKDTLLVTLIAFLIAALAQAAQTSFPLA